MKKVTLLVMITCGSMLYSDTQHHIPSVAYLFLLKDIFAQPTLMYRGGDKKKEDKPGEQFLTMFQDSLHDGFFGGVKWGIAACFYQVLYELSGNAISVIPAMIQCTKQIYTKIINSLAGKPDAVSVRDLALLAQLFHDAMHDFNEHVIISKQNQSMYIVYKNMVIQICNHLITYLQEHDNHYVDNMGKWTRFARFFQFSITHNAQEIHFVIILLIQNLKHIIECLEKHPVDYPEIARITHTSLQFFHILGRFLQHDIKAGETGVFSAWFSSKEITYDHNTLL